MKKSEIGRIFISLLLACILVFQIAIPASAEDLICEDTISGDLIKAGVATLLESDDELVSDLKYVNENYADLIIEEETMKEDTDALLDKDVSSDNADDILTDSVMESKDGYPVDNTIEDTNYDLSKTTEIIKTYTASSGLPTMTEDDYFDKVNSFIGEGKYGTTVWSGGQPWGANITCQKSPYGTSAKSCYAYCCDFAYHITDGGMQKASEGIEFGSVNDIQTGDVIKIPGPHYFCVLRRNGDELWTAEGNYSSHVRVDIGYKIQNGAIYQCGSGKTFNMSTAWHLVNLSRCCEMDKGIDKVEGGKYVIVSAKSLDDNNKIRKNRPYVLDIDGSDVIADRSLNEKSSVWSIKSEGDRFYSIKNIEKDRVMSLEEKSKDRKTNINIGKWYDDDCESYWAFDEKWTDKFVIYNKHSGMCATISDGDSIKQKEFYGKNDSSVDDQTWLLVYPEKPTIKTNSLPNGEVGKSYKATLMGSCDEWIAIEWSLVSDSAALPDGLTISKDGVISGTPTKAGNFNVKIAATNEFGTTTANYTIAINGDVVIPVTDVSLDKTSMELKVGNTAGLVATVLPADATNKKISWSTDNAGVATVDENGKVTAVSEGTARITASSADGSNKSATCLVTVTVPGGIKIKADDVTGVVGKTISVPVRISGNTGIGGMALTITSDSALTLTEIVRGDILAKGNINTDIKTGLVQWWTSNDNAEGDGVLFILKYDIKSEAKEGKYQISVSCTDGIRANITDKESVTLDVTIDNGSVIISKISIIPGDVIPDGVVAMGDVVKVAKAVAGNAVLTEEEKRAADVTGDGEVAMGDVVKIARYVAGAIKEL